MRSVMLVVVVAGAVLDAGSSRSPGRIVDGTALRVPRASHSASVLRDGRVLIAGGFGGSGTEQHPYASTEIFDPRTSSFTPGPSLVVGRSGHTATTLADGRILFAGGWTGSSGRGTAETYDPAAGRFTTSGRMRASRAGQTATLLRDGRVLLVGGVDEDDQPLASAELFDPSSASFVATGSMSVARDEHTATLLPDGRVAIIGGAAGHYPNEIMQSLIEIYDPATGRFTAGGSLETPRYKHGAILLGDGAVLVVGGSDQRAWRGQFASAEIYDPAQRSSRPVESMHDVRFKIPDALTMLADGRVLVAGGAVDAEIFDPTTRRFDVVRGSLGLARYFTNATLLRDGRVLITGGYGSEHGSLPASTRVNFFLPSS
jgi:hypothetical protein